MTGFEGCEVMVALLEPNPSSVGKLNDLFAAGWREYSRSEMAPFVYVFLCRAVKK